LALLTGFILGSLGVIWPWKNPIEQAFGDKMKVVGYEFFAPHLDAEFVVAFIIMLVGIFSIWLMERNARIIEKPTAE